MQELDDVIDVKIKLAGELESQRAAVKSAMALPGFATGTQNVCVY